MNAFLFVHEMKEIIEKQSRILHQVKRTMKKRCIRHLLYVFVFEKVVLRCQHHMRSLK